MIAEWRQIPEFAQGGWRLRRRRGHVTFIFVGEDKAQADRLGDHIESWMNQGVEVDDTDEVEDADNGGDVSDTDDADGEPECLGSSEMGQDGALATFFLDDEDVEIAKEAQAHIRDWLDQEYPHQEFYDLYKGERHTAGSLTQRTCIYHRRATRAAAALDPLLEVYVGDGETFNGPAVVVAYPDPDPVSIPAARDCGMDAHAAAPPPLALPLEEQEHTLVRVANALRTMGLPVAITRTADGARIPYVEVACDIEHHRRMMTTLATAPSDLRDTLMGRLGIGPQVVDLTRAAAWPDETE